MRGLARPLLRLVWRTRGARWGLVACALAMVALVVLHTVMQSARISGPQVAERSVGVHDASVQALAPVPFGESFDPTAADRILIEHGAERISHHLRVRPLDGSPIGGDIGYVEGDVFTDLPDAYRLVEGEAPQRPGQVCVTEPLAADAPRGSTLGFYAGALPLTVTCIAEARYATDTAEMIAAPGTWASAGPAATTDGGGLWSSSATVTTFWTGGEIVPAYDALMASTGTQVLEYEAGSAAGNLAIKDELVARPRSFNAETSPWTFLVPLLLLPPLAGFISGLTGGGLFSRSLDSLHRLGVRRRRLHLLSIGLPAALALGGAALGALLGLAMAQAARLLLEQGANAPLGPVVGTATVVAITAAGLILGSVLGGLVSSLRARRRANPGQAWLRLPRIPWPKAWALGLLAALCVGAGIWISRGTPKASTMVSGVVLFGAAAVLLTPVAISVWARGRRRNRRTLLAGRQIMAGGGTWVIVLLFGLQALLATGGLTAFTSSIGSFNDTLSRVAPLDEVRIEVVEEGEPTGMRERVAALLAEDLGQPRSYAYGGVYGPTDAADGLVFTVQTPQDAADFLGLDQLPDEAARAFEAGGVLRKTQAPGDKLQFLEDTGADAGAQALASVPVTVVAEADESLNSTGGLMKAEAAQAAGLPVMSRGIAFTDLTPQQVGQAGTAPDRLGFSGSWLLIPEAPDTFDIPPRLVQGAWIMTGLTLVLALVYSAQVATSMRPLAAGLRSQGLNARWTRGVALRQLAMVVLWPTLVGVIGGALGFLAVVSLGECEIALHVPWNVVAVLLGGSALSFAVGAVLCQRGVRLNERI